MEQNEANSVISENPLTEAGEKSSSSDKKIDHVYYEVGVDVLSKPTALVDVLEVRNFPPALVFCNLPSEADFVEVMLKRSNVSCAKLIGHVSPQRVGRAVEQLERGELKALVVTDIAARSIDLRKIKLIVNYSIHADPDTYLERSGVDARYPLTLTVVSLIAALDITNFHYVKKVVDGEIVKCELPKKEDLLPLRFRGLVEKALSTDMVSDDRVTHFSEMVFESEHKKEIVKYLLHNTLNVLPQASSQTGGAGRRDSRREAGEEREPRSEDSRGGRHQRFEDDDQGGSREGRGRQGNFGRERNSRNEGFNSRERIPAEGGFDEEGEEAAGFPGERPRSEREPRPSRERMRQSSERQSSERQPRERQPREYRIYIGSGRLDNFSEGNFLDLAVEKGGIAKEQIKRFMTRDFYSFADVAEEVAEVVQKSLDGADLPSGKKLLICKATRLPAGKESFGDDFSGDSESGDSSNFESDDNGGGDNFSQQQEREVVELSEEITDEKNY